LWGAVFVTPSVEQAGLPFETALATTTLRKCDNLSAQRSLTPLWNARIFGSSDRRFEVQRTTKSKNFAPTDGGPKQRLTSLKGVPPQNES
jgi:hypothetical protein